MEKKLFLLDAMALIFRAYYALIRNPRITSKGKNTNAQFVFTNTLLDLLNNQKPTHIAVCFDTAAPTTRHDEFKEYKAQRQEAPEDLLAAIPDIKRIIEGFSIPCIEKDGYEADDIIGTLSKKAAAEGFTVYMVTPDKDYGQLVGDGIYIYKPGYQGGSAEILDAKTICEKWNIQDVSQVVDILGLMGDAVDNIPGIRGIGEKTAAKLLAEYGTLENVLANADNIKGASGEKIRNGREEAILSKRLATIMTDVPVDFHPDDFKIKEWNRQALADIFTELEFKTLGKRILGDEFQINIGGGRFNQPQPQANLFGDLLDNPADEKLSSGLEPALTSESQLKKLQDVPHEYILVDDHQAAGELIALLRQTEEIAFDTETTGLDANCCDLVGMSFCIKPGKAWYVNFPAEREAAVERLELFRKIFEDPSKKWVGHNLKYDILVLKWYGVEITGSCYDTMLAHYVVDPEGKRNMDLLSNQFLSYEPIHIEELIGKKGKNQGNMRDVPLEDIKDYACEDADVTLQLKHAIFPLLKEKEVEKVFYEVENPLVPVLASMEFEGIRIDTEFLREYSEVLAKEAREHEERIYEQAGVKFNISSPRQLGEVLFDKLKLDPRAKKTRTGQYATGEDVLVKLAPYHPIVNDILGYRELTKLKSTYVDALPLLVNKKSGRIHTSFAQAVAVTGRLSSNNPNLQNIPVRTERGREIRKAFIPRNEDYVMLSADYSQIELRIVAAISGDPAMCEAFKEGKDIHTATASKVYGVREEDVTKEMRYKAKSVNFGIIYGQGPFGLAENLGISRTEAKEIIDNYKYQFSHIQKYMDDMIAFAREHGYVKTLMGRKRWLRDINSANFTVRSFAERNAINSPIQGTAADMIKMAMIAIHKEFTMRGFKSKMLLQVHDELVFDAHKDEVDIIRPIISKCMKEALPLPNGVPVETETGVGDNWLQAH